MTTTGEQPAPLTAGQRRRQAAKGRQVARLAAWDEGLAEGRLWPRITAWFDLLWRDHGFLRLAYGNRHPVSAGLWRSAQPSPVSIRSAAALGVKTVVSLRGPFFGGGDPLERDACRRAGLAFHRIVLHSRSAPNPAALSELISLYREAEHPILVHCKSGADRAGLAAAVWSLAIERQTAAVAASQLALRYGHIKSAKTGILDAFVALYAAEGEAGGLDFETWLTTRYDPEDLKARFKSNRAADLFLAVIDRE